MCRVLILLFIVFNVNLTFSQTNWQKGFDQGFQEGYCYNDIGCVSPPVPTSIPNIGSEYNSYKDGYNQGFAEGQSRKNKDASDRSNDSNRTRYKTSSPKFIDYVYKPNYEFAFKLVHNVQKGLDEAQTEMLKGNDDNAIYICKEILRILPGQVSANQLLSLCYLQKYKNEEKESLANLARYHAREAAKTKKYEFMVSMIENKLEEYAIDYAKKSKNYDLEVNNLNEKIEETEKSILNYKKNSITTSYDINLLIKDVELDFEIGLHNRVISSLKPILNKIEDGTIKEKKTIFFTYSTLASSYSSKHKVKECIKYATEAINNKINDEIGELFFIRGLSKSYLNDYYGSNSDYKYLIKNYKKMNYNTNNLPTVYNNLAYNLILQNKIKDAKPFIEKAIHLDTSKNYIWATKGELEFHLGNYSDAINAMSKSIVIKPTSNSYYYRGLAEIELGNKAKGCSDLSKAGEMGETKAYTEIKNKCNK
tara:strand:+ start:2991 stop:4427 length:1437 start_codon:yes stop_codon:yes gene_type:complete